MFLIWEKTEHIKVLSRRSRYITLMIQGRTGIINSIWFLRKMEEVMKSRSRVERRRAKRHADKVPGTVRAMRSTLLR